MQKSSFFFKTSFPVFNNLRLYRQHRGTLSFDVNWMTSSPFIGCVTNYAKYSLKMWIFWQCQNPSTTNDPCHLAWCLNIIICRYLRLWTEIYLSYANFHLTVSVLFSFPVLVFVRKLYSHSGWLLLKWSTIGLGFNGAETNCRIARILGILLMISYRFDLYFSDIIVVCAQSGIQIKNSQVTQFHQGSRSKEVYFRLNLSCPLKATKQNRVTWKRCNHLILFHVHISWWATCITFKALTN